MAHLAWECMQREARPSKSSPTSLATAHLVLDVELFATSNSVN